MQQFTFSAFGSGDKTKMQKTNNTAKKMIDDFFIKTPKVAKFYCILSRIDLIVKLTAKATRFRVACLYI